MSKQDTTESFRMAFATLHAHKFRSFLTVLGVVIGTVTVMVIASFISGLDQQFKQGIEVFGTNTVFIYKFDPGIHTGRSRGSDWHGNGYGDRVVHLGT